MSLDQAYWQNRYDEGKTGWDIGYPSPALISYFVDRNIPKTAEILIPGAGNAYEAEALFKLGYTPTVIDLASAPLENLLKRVPAFLKEKVEQADFFEHTKSYDYIIEQTFFCALDPTLRVAYAKQMQRLLKPKGKLVGLLFASQTPSGPPFGGTKAEYENLFTPFFSILEMAMCTNSIKPRQGNELFIELQAK